jgi:hypothetical protein
MKMAPVAINHNEDNEIIDRTPKVLISRMRKHESWMTIREQWKLDVDQVGFVA